VLLFVQFDDLMKKVSEALEFRGIDHLQITGSASKKSNALEKFQNNAHARVLLLNVIDESASGAYLLRYLFANKQKSHQCQSRHILVSLVGSIQTGLRSEGDPGNWSRQTIRSN